MFCFLCSPGVWWLRWRPWQSCWPFSVGFLSGPRKSAGETEQSRWSPDAAALQGPSARTRTLKHSQQHTAWTTTSAVIDHDECMTLQLMYKHTHNTYNSEASPADREIDSGGHENICSVAPPHHYFLRDDGQLAARGNSVSLQDTDMSGTREADSQFTVISLSQQNVSFGLRDWW